MTFDAIVSAVQDRLNLTSTNSKTRIGASVNERYRTLASSIGLDPIQRVIGVTAVTTIGNRALTFGPSPIPVEKILALYNTVYTPPMVLALTDMDTLRNEPLIGDPPTEYAIENIGPNFVTVYLNTSPATAYTLTADVLSNSTTLSGAMQPQFPEDFHDCLIYGAMAIELQKMEKYDFASEQQAHYEERVGDLRYYILKNAYMDIWQGRNTGISPTR